jgi:hypothetical protein
MLKYFSFQNSYAAENETENQCFFTQIVAIWIVSVLGQAITGSEQVYQVLIKLKHVYPLIGSALQGRDIVMHPGMGQSLVSLHSWVMWSSTIETFFSITGGSTLWGFIMLNTMCFQFNMLKICHPYDAIEKS